MENENMKATGIGICALSGNECDMTELVVVNIPNLSVKTSTCLLSKPAIQELASIIMRTRIMNDVKRANEKARLAQTAAVGPALPPLTSKDIVDIGDGRCPGCKQLIRGWPAGVKNIKEDPYMTLDAQGVDTLTGHLRGCTHAALRIDSGIRGGRTPVVHEMVSPGEQHMKQVLS